MEQRSENFSVFCPGEGAEWSDGLALGIAIRSVRAVREISDVICVEHGRSIIEKPQNGGANATTSGSGNKQS